jgi:hypothetical protein
VSGGGLGGHWLIPFLGGLGGFRLGGSTAFAYLPLGPAGRREFKDRRGFCADSPRCFCAAGGKVSLFESFPEAVLRKKILSP